MSEANGNRREGRASIAAGVNTARYRVGQAAGHYESFFLRANDPTRPRAFWIRYTLFHPQGHPAAAEGELWAVWFDGTTHQHYTIHQTIPLAQCVFAADRFFVRIGTAHLEPGRLAGRAGTAGHEVAWDLRYDAPHPPLLLLPPRLYASAWPRAKSLVGQPLACFSGFLQVDGQEITIADWVGSQNHNWGAAHTDQYAWGQVAGFANYPSSFLEVATARLRFGRWWLPLVTLLVLRHAGAEIRLNTWGAGLRAHATFDRTGWRFRTEDRAVRLMGRFAVDPVDQVRLVYRNPPGGTKICWNSKIARCDLTLVQKGRPGRTEHLYTAHRAAFEVLADPPSAPAHT